MNHFEEGLTVSYSKGKFSFKSVELTAKEALQLTDSLTWYFAGKDFEVTKELPIEAIENNDNLNKYLVERLHKSDIEYSIAESVEA